MSARRNQVHPDRRNVDNDEVTRFSSFFSCGQSTALGMAKSGGVQGLRSPFFLAGFKQTSIMGAYLYKCEHRCKFTLFTPCHVNKSVNLHTLGIGVNLHRFKIHGRSSMRNISSCSLITYVMQLTGPRPHSRKRRGCETLRVY